MLMRRQHWHRIYAQSEEEDDLLLEGVTRAQVHGDGRSGPQLDRLRHGRKALQLYAQASVKKAAVVGPMMIRPSSRLLCSIRVQTSLAG